MPKKKAKVSKRKFYRNTWMVSILSEEPLKDWSLKAAMREADSGAFVQEYCVRMACDKQLKPAQAVAALNNAGSEPGFFRLNDDGSDNGEETGDVE
jgi:hypothetical protein